MKHTRLILSAMIMCMAAGCSVDERLVEPLSAQKDKELTIQAIREDGITDTKTSRDESDGSVWWTPGDALSLFYGSGSAGGSKFITTATESCRSADFTGTIGVITGGGEGTTIDDTFFWGLYPYQEDASCDGSSINMTLPNVQTAVPGTFATNLFPTLAHGQGLVFKFYNICGGMMFSVTKQGVKKVTLKSNNGELIAGRAKVGLNTASELPEVKEIIDGSDQIVLKAPAGETFEVGKYYYVVMFPTTFTGGFTIKLETTTDEATVVRTNKITAKRSIFGKITDIDATATFSQKTGSIPVEDPNFKAYLVTNFDQNGDEEISHEEAHEIIKIDCSKMQIESLQGIEYMPNLTEINCRFNSLTSLDVSECTALTSLYCDINSLTSLNATGCTALTDLRCVNNSLSSLNISGCTELTNLDCRFNSLSGLDVSECTALTNLSCDNNSLSSLDVTACTALTNLSCDNNSVSSLDISGCTALTNLSCDNNSLSSLDVTACTALTTLTCTNNSITSLELSGYSELTILDCRSNSLTSLDVSGCSALTDLKCSENSLTSLDASNCTSLKTIKCQGSVNRAPQGSDREYIGLGVLSNLSVSGCVNLETLECYGHGDNLTEITGLEDCSGLVKLHAYYNDLKQLDFSRNTKLSDLYLAGNINLETLNISNCPDLSWMSIWDCRKLTTVDLSHNTSIKDLYISHVQAPDFTNNASLTFLQIGSPTSEGILDLSPLVNLKSLNAWHFRSLDLSNNVNLEYLWIGSSQCSELDLSTLTKLLSIQIDSWTTIESLDISNNINLFNFFSSECSNLKTLFISPEQSNKHFILNRDSFIHPDTQIIIKETDTIMVGDIINSSGKGVVTWVSEDKESCMLMSVDELLNKDWETSNDWCNNYGDGWRMPSIDELTLIHNDFSTINASLSNAGFTMLTTGNYCHWSNTVNPANSEYYYRERLHDGYIFTNVGSDERYNSTANRTRAVKLIQIN